MQKYVQRERAPELPEGTFGRYSDEYMFDTGHAYVTWGRLPRAGGWDDQEAAWRDALGVWLGYYAVAQHEQAEQQDEAGTDALFEADDDASDWSNVFGDA